MAGTVPDQLPGPHQTGAHAADAGATVSRNTHIGVLAFKRGFAEWSGSDREDAGTLAQHTLAALEELRAASASLG